MWNLGVYYYYSAFGFLFAGEVVIAGELHANLERSVVAAGFVGPGAALAAAHWWNSADSICLQFIYY